MIQEWNWLFGRALGCGETYYFGLFRARGARLERACETEGKEFELSSCIPLRLLTGLFPANWKLMISVNYFDSG